MAANLMASIFGGGSVTAPNMPTYNASTAAGNFDSQNFSEAQNISNNLTANTSAANLNTDLTGLNSVDGGAVAGINAEQNLGNTLLSGSGSALPAWAQSYMNSAKSAGSESAMNRGVGAFSPNGQSGVNQYVGNNAMSLVNMGAGLSSSASGQAQGIVNSNMYRADPMTGLLTAGQEEQAGELNTGILDQNATNATAAQNYDANNSPLGSAIRTGMQTLTYLAGSFLGGGGIGTAMDA